MFRLRPRRLRPIRRPVTAQLDRIEALETRQLLAADTTLFWGGGPGQGPRHSLELILENGSDRDPSDGELTINASEFARRSANFSGVVTGPASSFPISPPHRSPGRLEVELLFVLDEAAIPAAVQRDFLILPTPPGSPAQVRFSNLAVPLPVEKTYTLTVRARLPRAPAETVLTATPNLRIRVDTTSPMVRSVGPVEPARRNTPVVDPIKVTFSERIDPSSFDFEDLALTRDASPILLGNTVTVTRQSDTVYEIGGLTALTGSAGNYVLTVNAGGVQDIAGNFGTDSLSTMWVFDPAVNQPDPPGVPVLEAGSDTGARDNVTAAANPVFQISGAAPGNLVQLLRDGVVVNSRIGSGPVADPAPPNGVFRYTSVQVGPGGSGVSSDPSEGLTVVIDRLAPTGLAKVSTVDQSFTGNALVSTTNRRPSLAVELTDLPRGFANRLNVELVSIDGRTPIAPVVLGQDIPATANSANLAFPVPEDLSPGLHTVTLRATDLAGNTTTFDSSPFFVQENRSTTATGSPVFTTVFDLDGLVPPLEGNNVSNKLFPWNISFDRTTQTIWFVLRGQDTSAPGDMNTRDRGNHVVHLDPVTGKAQVYDLGITAGEGIPNTGPHSVFFDFESHLTPRVWFAQRTAGLVSYLDVATSTIITYDLRAILEPYKGQLGLDEIQGDVHAIVVDRRGVAWVSDPDDGLILEIDTRVNAATGGTVVNTDRGTMTVHVMPEWFTKEITNAEAGLSLLPGADEVGLHGLDVVTDDRPGSNTQPYVYFSVLGSGGIGLLVPRVGTGSDRWLFWDVAQALAAEGSVAPNGKPVGNPLFVAIDSAETRVPEDDRIFFSDPGSQRTPNSVVRALYPGNALLNPNATSSPVQTWMLPPLPETVVRRPDGRLQEPQPNQPYVDRQGTVFFIDRQSGVGRLDTNSDPLPLGFQSPGRIVQAPLQSVFTDVSLPPISLSPQRRTARLDESRTARTFDTSSPTIGATISPSDFVAMDGLDQYQVRGGGTNVPRQGQPTGPFRGTLTAGSTLYGSLTQNDQLAAVLFTETVRRPMDVVLGSDGTRFAFQVLRSGDLILTWRGPGEVVDRQLDITRGAIPGQIGPAIVGNVSSVVDGRGVVHVFGKDRRGGMTEYLFDPSTSLWSFRQFLLPPVASGPLASNPTAFNLDDAGQTAAVFVTTGDGHLVMFRSDSDAPNDLSGQPGSAPIFGEVGELSFGGSLYVYGTDMTGQLVEYAVNPSTGTATSRRLTVPGGPANRVFQDVEALLVNGVRHILGTNGFSQLVHIQIDAQGNVIDAENVSQTVQATAAGYSAYQQPFAGRVYSDLAVGLDPATGILYVYGTNGRDLVEFRRSPAGIWEATNLTNHLNGPNDPANRVFGAPALLILPNGDRHILLINEDAEVVEYYRLAGLPFATYNITLALGNDPDTASFPNTLLNRSTTPRADDPGRTPGPQTTDLTFDPTTLLAIGSDRIEPGTDTDTFRFVAPRSGRIRLRVEALTPGLKARFSVLNGRRRLIVGNRGRSVAVDVIAGKTYFVVISSRGGTTGSYRAVIHYVGKAAGAPGRGVTPRVLPSARQRESSPSLPRGPLGPKLPSARAKSLPPTHRLDR